MILAIGVPTNIVNTIKTMCDNTTCSVIVNGWTGLNRCATGVFTIPYSIQSFLDFLVKEVRCLQEICKKQLLLMMNCAAILDMQATQP